MSFLKNLLPVPILIPHSSNPTFPVIRFQFIPTNFTQHVASTYAESTSLNRQNPILQFTKGELEVFTFDARLFSQHAFHEINSLLALLKHACERDEVLRRPPVWFFIWGSAVQETVVIDSIGGIKFDDLRPDGLLRGVTLTISLKKYVAYDIKLTDVNKAAPTGLLTKITKSNTFWEGLALKTYGDALMGTVLALTMRPKPINAGPSAGTTGGTPTATPIPGATYVMPSRDDMARKQLTPISPVLRPTPAAVKARADIFKTRNARTKQSSVIVRGAA